MLRVELEQSEWDDVILALRTIGGAFQDRGEPEKSEALFGTALKIFEQAHVTVGRPLPHRFSFEAA